MQRSKLLKRMRANPRDDWRIEDVETVCKAYDLDFRLPSSGSHCVVSHPGVPRILTIPARRPIKPVYIRHLVKFIAAVHGDDAEA
jgi:hypothetical protein